MAVNGRNVSAAPDPLGYVTLDRDWQQGDRVDIQFPFTVRKVVADARVREARGQVAIERGPIVYCAEWPDTDDGRALSLLLDSADFSAETASLYGGVTVINASARKLTNPSAAARPVKLTPYPTGRTAGLER
jgi:DUF1680 family protein